MIRVAHQLSERGELRSQRERVLLGAVIVLVSLIAAHYIAGLSGSVPKPLAILLVAACAAIMLSVSAEHLLLGWLFLAPLLQESAGKTRIGHLLSLALFTAPPLLFSVKILVSKGWRPRREWFDVVPAFFVVLVFASLVVTSPSALRSGTVGTLRGFYQTVALGALVYYVIAFWRGQSLSAVRVCAILLAASALQAVMVTVEWRTGWNLWHDTTWQQGGDVRSIGTLANPALTGAFIGTGIVIALSVLCWEGPPILKRLAVFMVIVGLPGLYATKTRGPILATVIAVALCVLLSSRSRLTGLLVIGLTVLAIVALWPTIKNSSVYQNRIDQTQNVEIRLILQQISIKLAEEKPILGWGYNSFDRVKFSVPVYSAPIPLASALAFTSHDTFLTMVVEYGLVGLGLFLLPWAPMTLRALRRTRVRSPDRWMYVAGLTTSLVIFGTATTLDYRFFSFIPILPWMFLGLMRRADATPDVRPPDCSDLAFAG